MIFTELAPLTPEIASSMLSWMYCEKLNVTPGSAVCISRSSCAVSFAFVRPRGQSSKGFSGTNSSTFEKGDGSLPLSGRPCCEMTVTTCG